MPPKSSSVKRENRTLIKEVPKAVDHDIPHEVLGNIEAVVSSVAKKNGGLGSADGVAGKLRKDLKLPNIDTDAVDTCLESEDPVRQLRNLAIEKFRQKARAERVFELLDDSGKGCVILQDLQRVASEILDEDLSDDDLIEMVSEIDRSGDGLLQKDDFIHLAALIDL